MNPYKAVIQRLRRLLQPRGYRRKDLAWYRYGGKVTTAVFVRFADYRLNVQLALFDRSACRETHPDIRKAMQTIGMSALVPDRDEWVAARDISRWTVDSDLDKCIDMIEQYALPRLMQWEQQGHT